MSTPRPPRPDSRQPDADSQPAVGAQPAVDTQPDLDTVRQRLRGAGLPADDLVSRRAGLPAAVQQLHRHVLTTIADTGHPPTPAALAGQAESLHLDARQAMARLAQAELLFLDPAGDAVLGGVPFAGGPTAHQVHVYDGPTVSANCAVDALGVGAMLGRDTKVRSTDPTSGAPVTATQRDGRWTWQPAEAVVFVGSNGEGRITDSCCPVINFFADEYHARAYQQQHGLTGEILTMPEATQAGELVFGELLAPPQ